MTRRGAKASILTSLVLVWTGGCVQLGCSGGSGSDAGTSLPCTTDEDCPVGAPVCAAGACSGIECETLEDCADGETCFLTLCTERRCETDSDCKTPLECIDGVCFPPFTVDWVARGYYFCGGYQTGFELSAESVAWVDLASDLPFVPKNSCPSNSENQWRLKVRPYHGPGAAADLEVGVHAHNPYHDGGRIFLSGQHWTPEECENPALPDVLREYLFDFDASVPSLEETCDPCQFDFDEYYFDSLKRGAMWLRFAATTAAITDLGNQPRPIEYYEVSTVGMARVGEITLLPGESFVNFDVAPGKVCWEMAGQTLDPEPGRFRVLDVATGEVTVFPGMHPSYERFAACDADGFYTHFRGFPGLSLELHEYDLDGTLRRVHTPGQEAWLIRSDWRSVGRRFWVWSAVNDIYALDRSSGVSFHLPFAACAAAGGDHLAFSYQDHEAPPRPYLFVLHFE